jgi:DNA-binding transcriptional ArsR family regulator
MISYRQAKNQAEVLKALGNPVRVLIVHALQKGALCVSDLNKLTRINQSNMTRHLQVLKKAGIINDERDGTHVFYSLQATCALKACDLAAEAVQQETRRRVELTKFV